MSHYIPFNYENLNLIQGTIFPSSVKNINNRSFWFWERALFQRACSAIITEEFPEDWEGTVKDFFYYCVFAQGYTIIYNHPAIGNDFQPGSLDGQDLHYQPRYALICNPMLNELLKPTGGSLKLEIGKDCQILKLTPDFMGIWDIISYYAEKLSLLDNAINMSLINSKFSWILGARNKVAGNAIKKIMDKVNAGEPFVVYDVKLTNDPTDKDSPFQFLDFGNVKEKYITSLQLQDMQTILNNFDAEIGIPTVPYAKKERMVTSEAESRQIDSTSRASVWVDCLNSSAKKVMKLYPDIKLKFKLRHDPEEMEVSEDGKTDIDRNV